MTMSTNWTQELTRQAKDKIAEDELYIRALSAVFEETSHLNDSDIVRILIDARKLGLDGRKTLARAFNERFGGVAIPEIDQRTYRDIAQHEAMKANIGPNKKAPEFQCPNCRKEFKSQAALSGHGLTRCKR